MRRCNGDDILSESGLESSSLDPVYDGTPYTEYTDDYDRRRFEKNINDRHNERRAKDREFALKHYK